MTRTTTQQEIERQIERLRDQYRAAVRQGSAAIVAGDEAAIERALARQDEIEAQAADLGYKIGA